MASILTSLRNTVIAGFVLATVLLVIYGQIHMGVFDHNFGAFVLRYLHVLALSLIHISEPTRPY